MESFNSFYDTNLNESKFRQLPMSVVKEATKVVEKYYELVQEITPKQLKKLKKLKISAEWEEYFKSVGEEVWAVLHLTDVKFVDLSTNKKVKFNVVVAFGENNENYAVCLSDSKIIILYDYACRFIAKEKLTSTVIHEITHGFQEYKDYSKKYQKLGSSFKNPAVVSRYYKEPIEFDAFSTEMAHLIRTQHTELLRNITNAKLPETKEFFDRKLDKFFLELKNFISSPLETYFAHKELSLPSSLETFDEMLQHIQRDPKLKKKLKNKLIGLYNELIQKES